MPENKVTVYQNTSKRQRRRQKKQKKPSPPPRPPLAKQVRKTPLLKNFVTSTGALDQSRQAHDITGKIEQKTGVPAFATVITGPSVTNRVFNVTAFHAIVEVLVSHYAMTTDLFSVIQPIDLVYYFGMMAMAHLNSFGGLTSAGNFPTNTRDSEYPIPYAFAKYLEYISPYTYKGIKSSFRWNYANNTLIGTPSTTYGSTVGVLNTVVPDRPTDWPHWCFAQQESAVTGSLEDAPVPHVLFFDYQATPVEANFGTFLQDATRLTLVSNEVSKRGNTIPLGRIPRHAPDSSAYSVFYEAGDGYEYTGTLSVDNNYDPELTHFFGMSTTAPPYSQMTAKSVPMPMYQFTAPTQFPPAFQVLSTWVFLAQNLDGPYRPGKIRKVFPFCAHKLRTLFPLRQYYDGAALGELVQSVHTQVLASKGTVSSETLDANNYNLTLAATVAYSAMQYRRNLIEVMHIQCPPVEITADPQTDVYFPQVLYSDVTWNTTLPTNISAVLSAIGPVVYDGKLVVPIADYKGIVTFPGSSRYGPMGWSAYGLFTGTSEITVPLSIPWGFTGDGTIPAPNIMYDPAFQPALNCNTVYCEDFYGCNPDLGQLFTIIPTAGVATTLISQYKAWLQYDVAGQSIPLLQMNKSLYGDVTVMTTATTVTLGDSTVVGGNNAPSDQPAVVCTVGGHPSITTTQPATSQSAGLASVAGVGIKVVSATEGIIDNYRELMNKVLLRRPSATVPTDVQPIIGPHTVDIPWSAGKMGVLATLAQQFASTTSSFANHAASIQRASDYNIVKTFKEYASPTLQQSFQSVPVKRVAMHQLIEQSKGVLSNIKSDEDDVPVKTNKVKGAFKWAVDKGIDVAKKGLEPVIKEATKEAKEVFNFL